MQPNTQVRVPPRSEPASFCVGWQTCTRRRLERRVAWGFRTEGVAHATGPGASSQGNCSQRSRSLRSNWSMSRTWQVHRARHAVRLEAPCQERARGTGWDHATRCIHLNGGCSANQEGGKPWDRSGSWSCGFGVLRARRRGQRIALDGQLTDTAVGRCDHGTKHFGG